MSTIESDLRYASTHEWARLETDGTVTVGITDHAKKLSAMWSLLNYRP